MTDRIRNQNERLLLWTIHRHGPLPGSDMARLTGLSPQTVSVILRKLEHEGLVSKGAPQRGRVGKPSVPMGLTPDGLLSVGLKIGRRTADLMLIDFHGTVVMERHTTYRYPLPGPVFGFLRDGLSAFGATIGPDRQDRIAGIGIAAPFEIWNWPDALAAPRDEMQAWRGLEFAAEVAEFSDLPVFVQNDATAACRAEHVYGRGSEFSDYAYFYLGTFIGGGIVLNGAVFEGRHQNAGAFGSLPVPGPRGTRQLIETASIHLLESRLAEAGHDPQALWKQPQDWSAFAEQIDPWISEVARAVASAAVAACAVIDAEAVLIDGAFPADIRMRLVDRVERELRGLDMRGLVAPRVAAGTVGGNARVLGAASAPIFAQYLLPGTPAH
jgi:predicted NBD/HSP70 family sugar kinase